jgi:hypothetical protein
MAAISAGKARGGKWFSGYVMIGDDIAIFDEKVAETYKGILARLGVPINLAKSVAPPPSGVGAVEIAKRTFVHGEELSPCPPDIILQARKEANLFPVLLELSLDRDIVSPYDRSPVMSLLERWYQPSSVERVELVLYDPRDSRALLKAGDPSESPWEGMSEADVATEVDYVFLRRIKDKATNLQRRLSKQAKLEIEGLGHAQIQTHQVEQDVADDYHISLPTAHLRHRLELVART